jgi:opacity protein-like surface antigen
MEGGAMRNLCKMVMGLSLVMAVTVGAAEEGSWNWGLSPYAWMSGMEGDVAVGPTVSHVDMSFSDVLDVLEVAAFVSIDGNNGRWGVVSDFAYVGLDDTQDTAIGNVKAELDEVLISAIPYVRVVTCDKMTVDVGAGVRYMDIDVKVSTPARNINGSRDWADPIVMARLRRQLTEKCFLNLAGDIGGFGVESDFTWQVTATAGRAITENVDLLVGYRHLDIDYRDGEFDYDLATRGFAVGVHVAL